MCTSSRIRSCAWLIWLVQSLAACQAFGQAPRHTAFMPDQWPKEDLDRYLTLEYGFDPDGHKRIEPQRAAVSSKAMIAGTNEPLAVHVGLEVVKHGGNAADAALATSLAQIALTAGAAISYAGIMTAVYYDAASGKVYTLDAGYNTVQNEKEPLTIPKIGEHSGRTALVPGFMAGVQALHDRFGKLPFASLFGPAIWIAERGFTVNPVVSEWLRSQKDFITRLPETRRVLTKENGEIYLPGDTLRQPELAATLKKVASQGSGYMYKGEWARHFVDLVQREGGKVTLQDLAAYRAVLSEQAGMPYRDYRVVAQNGSVTTLLGLKVAEAADLKKYGHYASSAEALYYLIQVSRIAHAFTFSAPQRLTSYFPDIDPTPESRLTKDAAEKLWAHIKQPNWPDTIARLMTGQPGPGHSAGVLVVDEEGNVASVLHTINCTLWGATGIFVDGISIPDSATFQQQMIARVGPGARLPDTTNPLLVLKKGKPVLASSAVGSGLHDVTIQNLINVLDFGMDPKKSVGQPNTRGPFYGMLLNKPGKGEYEKEAISDGEFPPEILDGGRARGQAIKMVGKYDQPGYWIGIQIDPESRKLGGGTTPLLPALVEGY